MAMDYGLDRYNRWETRHRDIDPAGRLSAQLRGDVRAREDTGVRPYGTPNPMSPAKSTVSGHYGYEKPAAFDDEGVGDLWDEINSDSERARRVERLSRLNYLSTAPDEDPTQEAYQAARHASRGDIATRKLSELRAMREAEAEPAYGFGTGFAEDGTSSGLEELGQALEPVGEWLEPVPDWLAEQAWDRRPRPRVFGQEIF